MILALSLIGFAVLIFVGGVAGYALHMAGNAAVKSEKAAGKADSAASECVRLERTVDNAVRIMADMEKKAAKLDSTVDTLLRANRDCMTMCGDLQKKNGELTEEVKRLNRRL